ncbi:MAG: NAD(P)-binding domain-containing protein [Actinomycetota bacterium]|nr:NAD(P)-binding domain-containing protein [Actinomycetota bacterium]
MKVGILGTGRVGRTLAEGFAREGHEVMIGTRDVEALMERTEPDQQRTPPFRVWHAEHKGVAAGAFAEAGAFGELLVNSTAGTGSVEALEAAGAKDLDGRIVIDTSNALDFSQGFPPSLFVGNTDSLAETIQREFPRIRVVKAWNTVTAALMTNPKMLAEGDHTIPICGNDGDAKKEVTGLLQSFGWRDVIDLGDLTAARAMEGYLPFWLRLMQALQNPIFNTKVVR